MPITPGVVPSKHQMPGLAVRLPGKADARSLRFFTGLDEREAAEALGISVSTLKRDWEYARAWLFSELR